MKYEDMCNCDSNERIVKYKHTAKIKYTFLAAKRCLCITRGTKQNITLWPPTKILYGTPTDYNEWTRNLLCLCAVYYLPGRWMKAGRLVWAIFIVGGLCLNLCGPSMKDSRIINQIYVIEQQISHCAAKPLDLSGNK